MSIVLTILGASVRAAVQSARGAGFETFAADLFADVDTRACSPAMRIADFPKGFLDALAASPPGPWMYTGGLENHPQLVATIAREKPLWGNDAHVLRRIRDPLAVAAALTQAGLPSVEVQRHPPEIADSRPWLVKPLASCGGSGIEFDDRSPQVPARRRRWQYWQCYCPGAPVAAVFVAGTQQTTLLGVTRQLIGVDWAGAGGFRYCGSIGPLRLGRPLTEQVEHVGNVLSRQFNLRGLFGVDGVISDDKFWTIEVNPRYTASVEILERAGCDAPIALHAAACGAPPSDRFGPPLAAKTPIRQFGKAIIYASADIRVGLRFVEAVQQINGSSAEPLAADIPPISQHIPAAHPVATVFSAATGEDQVLAELRRRCDFLRALLEIPPSANVNNRTR